MNRGRPHAIFHCLGRHGILWSPWRKWFASAIASRLLTEGQTWHCLVMMTNAQATANGCSDKGMLIVGIYQCSLM